MTRWTLSFLALLLPSALAKSPGAAADAPKPRQHLIHLPGIAGEQHLDRQFVKGLREGGYSGTLEIVDWPRHDAGLNALFARKRNGAEADKLAERLQKLVKEDPSRRISVIAHSGGSGIAAWALERLPDDVKIDTLVFVAPALSHVRGKAYALTSVNDAIVLGAGTRVFGTIDGKKEEAAGLRGFKTPDEPADAKQYDKLVQMPYQDSWMELGNIGDHIGPMGEEFAEKVIAPLLQDRPPAPLPTSRPTRLAGERPVPAHANSK